MRARLYAGLAMLATCLMLAAGCGNKDDSSATPAPTIAKDAGPSDVKGKTAIPANPETKGEIDKDQQAALDMEAKSSANPGPGTGSGDTK